MEGARKRAASQSSDILAGLRRATASPSKGMRVSVYFFGVAHDLTGLEQEQLEVAPDESLGALLRRYETRFPRLREMAGSLLTAVNQEIADPSRVLRDGD